LIGLGIIGSRVANALRLSGYHVYVWNRTPRAAPNFLASPHQVAELCDIIQLFVADAQALFSVLDSMTDALTPSHVIVCNATVGPEATIDAARLVQDRGARFLDAPFTGSKAAAENRQLVYYIGGEDKTLQAVEPVLKASSKSIVKIGKIGDAATIKVATNMLAAVTVQTLAEAYAIVKGSGIDPATLGEALKHHGIRSDLTDAKLAKILSRDYEPHFSLKHMFKDVQLGIHIANSLDIDLPATTSTAGVMYGGLTRGWADDDFSVLARSYQKEDQPAPPHVAPTPKALDQAPPTAPQAQAPPVKPADSPAAATPSAEKKEPPREPTVEELRNVGIKLPELPAITTPPPVEKAAAPAPAPTGSQSPDGSSAPAPLAAKTEPAAQDARDLGVKVPDRPVPPAEEKPASPKTSELPKPEPAKLSTPIAEPPKTEAPKAEAAPVEIIAAKPAESFGDTNGVPGEPARTHTPFVRIRRWFGTGSAN
jgi:3-hydroxyisobutyrate dehydrogenase-like beta-hydroxyacid dehydrogenase